MSLDQLTPYQEAATRRFALVRPLVVAFVVFALVPVWGVGAAPESRARQLLQQALDNPKDQVRIGKLLAELEAEIAVRPGLPENHCA